MSKFPKTGKSLICEKSDLEFVIFDIRADLAHFKKPFTSMSPQTFGFPTGTALVGMIAAIIGLEKNVYWEHFQENTYAMAVGVKKPLKKTVIPINTLKTTSMKHFSRYEEHKRTTMEFIKDGEFRVWFYWENENLFHQLIGNLRNHETYYTVSLGLAWNLADFTFCGEYGGEQIEGDGEWTDIQSVIRRDVTEEIEFEGRKIFANRIPVRMKQDGSRIVENYGEYLFESDGRPIRAKVKEYIKLHNGDCIVPL